MLMWRDAMSVGHPGIDAAHKHLIARINAFEKALAVTSGAITSRSRRTASPPRCEPGPPESGMRP